MQDTAAPIHSLSDKERDLVERARRFRREVVAPEAARWERERQQPLEAIRAAAKLGFTAIEVPAEHGGQGARFIAKALIAEELARSCMSFAFSLINTQNVASRVALQGTQAQIARHLAPLVAGERLG